MLNRRTVEIMVGIFMIMGMIALTVLALKVSGLSTYAGQDYYHVIASFDNIGSLKERAPVTIAGVKVGEVQEINLDPDSYRARVTLLIKNGENHLPTDTSASILTAGLLGANYIALSPGFDATYLKDGSQLDETHPALILENLIGQFIFNQNHPKKEDKKI